MIGSVARVPSTVSSGRLTQDTVHLRFIHRDKAVESYVYWLLRTPQYRDYCAGRATGSAVVALSRRDFLSYPVPSLTAARRQLVDTLEQIEERVGLLRETNATLEAIAQALFKSWFVDFDPVRAKMQGGTPVGMDEATARLFPAKFVNSEEGEIPAGWRHTSLREAVLIHDAKRVPLSSQERSKRPGPYPYYGAATLMDSVDDFLFDGTYLLVGEDGSVSDERGCPVTQYVWGRFWVNNHAHVLQGAGSVSTEHLMLALKRTNIQPLITGAVQAKLSQANMWRIRFLMPPDPVAASFSAIIAPLFARMRHNTDQANNLSALRDTLLPRLVSGRLRPREAAA